MFIRIIKNTPVMIAGVFLIKRLNLTCLCRKPYSYRVFYRFNFLLHLRIIPTQLPTIYFIILFLLFCNRNQFF
jgi:hypothetical protein